MRKGVFLFAAAVMSAPLAFAGGFDLPAINDWRASSESRAELPFTGHMDGVLLGFEMDEAVIEARCHDPANPPPEGKAAWAVTSFEGWGPVTHMGLSYVFAEHCSYATQEGPDGTYGQGELTIIAANGDILRATYDNGVSLSPPPFVGFMDHVTFVDGGTGRFTFASGGGVETGSVNLIDNTFSVQLIGVIRYSRR